MSIAGVIGLFRARPQHPISADGRMALGDHLRELRARILRCVLVLIVALVIALLFYDQLLSFVYDPYRNAVEQLSPDTKTIATINGVGGPLLLQLKLAALAAVVCTSPYWLYQIWAFIVPGLHPNEKRWTLLFASVAGPLFMVGVAVGYYVLPKGLSVLIGFTPVDLTNLVDFGEYFSFMTRMLLVFGVAFEIPLFVVMLNLAGVVSGKSLGRYRPWIVIGTFVFAAVATPSTDPFSMLMLAVPMTALFFLSELIARVVDRRRGRTAYDGLADDEQSSVGGPSSIDEDED
ncbi:MAG: twin-arginine translocase subunit TatC [Nocardioidaceae bacterium]|nr:twin-arginine translocase subunit TatC [Nocardioidaceae bacterium]NUS52833.1 twin-arginine translocase subunit TatC [Nocardioidaceae bacterium]